MSTVTLSDSDEGKRVVTGDGDEIGMITEVRGGRAYVDPDPGMFDQIKARFDWGDSGEDSYPIDSSEIAEVTDDEVRLSRR